MSSLLIAIYAEDCSTRIGRKNETDYNICSTLTSYCHYINEYPPSSHKYPPSRHKGGSKPPQQRRMDQQEVTIVLHYHPLKW